jgi:dethiobiotin synthetase
MSKFVVAGIHTGIGKTVVSTIITEALEGYYWKPVQCGAPLDSKWVAKHLSLKNRCFPEGVVLKEPCSPHLAARMEKVTLSPKNFTLPNYSGSLVIEGTGGILAPINETKSWVDIAKDWDAKWILVHHHYLGSLNHFLLTVEALRKRNISLAGIIFNGDGDLATEEMLCKRAKTTLLGKLKWERQLKKSTIKQTAKEWKKTLLLL